MYTDKTASRLDKAGLNMETVDSVDSADSADSDGGGGWLENVLERLIWTQDGNGDGIIDRDEFGKHSEMGKRLEL